MPVIENTDQGQGQEEGPAVMVAWRLVMICMGAWELTRLLPKQGSAAAAAAGETEVAALPYLVKEGDAEICLKSTNVCL